jgi:hypothetical protein
LRNHQLSCSVNGMELLACFPIVAVALVFGALVWQGDGLRAAFIRATTYWGVAVFAITEALSALHGLTSAGLAVAWLLADAVATIYVLRVWVAEQGKQRGRAILTRMCAVRRGFDLTSAVFLSGIVLVLALVGLTALLYPPNTSDSMVYHMPRIVHWLHNRSVGFYATTDFRQLKMAPWAEFAMLQFQGLTGGDRFANFVQCFAMLGSAVGVSLIAGKLGASLRGQVFAAAICATIRQGILEASGTKNDYVVGFWLVVLVYYLFAYKDNRTLANAVGIGISLGLACLTKTTAFIYAPPLLLAMALTWPRDRWRVYMRHIILVGAVALSLNASHFLRNYTLFGTPLGPSAEVPPDHFAYINDRFGAFVTLSNVIRNVGLHLGTNSEAQNVRATDAAKRFLAFFGVDINDPGTTWDNTAFQFTGATLHEAGAGNMLNVLLIAVTLVLLARRLRAQELRPALTLALGLVAAFVLFCAVLRWQPWHTRLHLPLFLLWSAVAATVLADSWPRFGIALIGTILFLNSIPALLDNETRPLRGGTFNAFNQPRPALYFGDWQALRKAYAETAKFTNAQHCADIGISGGIQYPYPLFALLGDLNGARNIREVGITNASSIYDSPPAGSPCVMICPNCQGRAQIYSGHYPSVRVFGDITVFAEPCAMRIKGYRNSFSFTGWYGRETDDENSWRWTARKGEVHILSPQPAETTLNGELTSVRSPNTVDILVNGVTLASVATYSPAPWPIGSLHLQLKAGDNVLEFASRNKGVQLPTDSRVLAIAIRNLRTETTDGGGCPVE